MEKRKVMMQAGVVVLILMLVGGIFANKKNIDVKNPCFDAITTLNKEKNLILSSLYNRDLNLDEWKKTAKVSASKFPSGIDVFYKFETIDENKSLDVFTYTLSLIFSSIDDNDAIAYVYPHSGAVMLDHESDLFSLQKKKINHQLFRFSTKKTTGGVAVVTCQNGKTSVISIDLPGYKQ